MAYSGHSCRIENNGTLTGIKLNYEEDQKTEQENLDDIDALFYLNATVELATGILLGDIFKMVEDHDALKLMVMGYSCCPDIDKFHEQSKKPETKDRTYDTLVIQPEVNLCDYGPESWLDLHWDWFIETPFDVDKGDYYDETTCEDCKNKVVHKHVYSASFIPVNELAKMKVIIRTEVFPLRGTIKSIKPFNIRPTLMDVLDTIYDEISFCGSPEETEDTRQEIQERLDSFDAGELDVSK